MKIASICLTGPFTEGYAYQDNLINKYFAIMGHDCTIIANDKIYKKGNIEKVDTGEKIIDNNIKLIRLRNKDNMPEKFVEKFRMYEGLYESLETIKPDLIFVHGLQFLDIKHIVRYKKKYKNVKIVVDNHADFSNSATNFLSKNILHKVIWKRCAKLIEPYTNKFYGVLPARVNFLHDIYGIESNKIELLVMGADTNEIKFNQQEKIRKDICDRYNLNYDDFILITGGKIDKSKKEVLNLMKSIKKYDINNIKLLVFGSVDSQLEGEFNSLVDNDKIKYIGWLNSNDVYDYFLASNLGVFPGRHSVLWEQAVGSGLPCVFKRWDGTEHIDLDGNCKFLQDGTEEEILEVIQSIVYNQDIYKKMKDISVSKGINYFSYEKISIRSIDI